VQQVELLELFALGVLDDRVPEHLQGVEEILRVDVHALELRQLLLGLVLFLQTRVDDGVTIGELDHIYDVYMSPGSVTERLHFYAAPYTPSARTEAGGGVVAEGEDIEIVELPYDEALGMIDTGQIVDGKTIMLLYWAALRGPYAGGPTP